MPDKNDFSEFIADLLRGQDRLNTQVEDLRKETKSEMAELRKENKENTDRTIAAFNSFATAVLKRLDSIDVQLTKLADVEERLKRLEAEVFKR